MPPRPGAPIDCQAPSTHAVAVTGLELDLSFAALAFGPDPIVLFMIALLADAALGSGARRGGRFLAQPNEFLARLVATLERRLNRHWRGAATRLVRGFLATLVVVGASAAAGWGVASAADAVPFAWVLVFLLILSLVSPREPFERSRAVARALDRDGLVVAREAAEPLFGTDSLDMNEHDLSAAAVLFLARRFNEGFVAAAFWFVFLGLPGLAAYRAIDVMGNGLGDDEKAFVSFGFTASRLNEVVCYLPAFLAGLLLALAAVVVPGASPPRTLAALTSPRAPKPLSRGWPTAAMFGAFGLAPPQVGGGALAPGAGLTLPGGMLARALYLYAVAALIGFACVALVAMVRVGL